MPERDNNSTGGRVTLIQAVTTPLGFSVLAVCVVEAVLGSLLWKEGYNPTVLFAMVGVILVLAVAILLVGYLRPEALHGIRVADLDQTLAHGLGDEVYASVDGYLGNLAGDVRLEAYALLCDCIESTLHAKSKDQKTFVQQMATSIRRRSELSDKVSQVVGVVGQDI